MARVLHSHVTDRRRGHMRQTDRRRGHADPEVQRWLGRGTLDGIIRGGQAVVH